MQLLDNVIQRYDWGSRTAIAELQGRAFPSATPEAELWMGAHPAAPSRLRGTHKTLLELVGEAPEATLGPRVHQSFGGFPFLLKVLAAGQPLSIQAHPSKAQAEAGFADEEARGVPRSAPHRNYKDPNHKPELLCALTRFEALCGFRAPAETVRLLDLFNVADLAPEREMLATRGAPDGVREAFRSIMQRAGDARTGLLRATLDACRAHKNDGGEFQNSIRWSLQLAELYPDDVGVVSSLLLNQLVLQPGEAIYLPAGNLHAYLAGVGVEIMASSDNVLRGGLTPKHVDLSELLRVVDFGASAVTPLRPTTTDGHAAEAVYETPAPDFRLSRVALADGTFTATVHGPEILLCTEGELEARAGTETITLTPGNAALVPASDARYTITGTGVVFRATVGTSS